jgi:hypothetical protein
MDRPPRRRPPGVPVPDTIEGIERVRVDPGTNDTNLIRRCVALRRKPLSQFTTEDLRLMLGQQIAVPILLPTATRAGSSRNASTTPRLLAQRRVVTEYGGVRLERVFVQHVSCPRPEKP